jgi:hypothetical protein
VVRGRMSLLRVLVVVDRACHTLCAPPFGRAIARGPGKSGRA